MTFPIFINVLCFYVVFQSRHSCGTSLKERYQFTGSLECLALSAGVPLHPAAILQGEATAILSGLNAWGGVQLMAGSRGLHQAEGVPPNPESSQGWGYLGRQGSPQFPAARNAF